MIRPLRTVFTALAALVMSPAVAAAHPHVWVTMKSELLYDGKGAIVGVRHAWTFDDMFSTFAIQGLDTAKPGVFTREELQPLAEVNVTALQEYSYFTFAKVNGKELNFGAPVDYFLELRPDKLLTLRFTLPLKQPVKTTALNLEVFDPSYFVDFSFDEKAPDVVVLKGAPAGCKASLKSLREGEKAPQIELGDPRLEVPNPEDWGKSWGAQFANQISVKC